ncbi:hypothetical protein JCGZ_23696 [Jatropha curcas]|uniref:Uncharacterized protein n=1 Tax=Jatropha curcas TaxID=180498 RepID=A0A067L2T3_JATCU|nr:hypothetical protein JCGZ_23696 [Jatropha curcas]
MAKAGGDDAKKLDRLVPGGRRHAGVAAGLGDGAIWWWSKRWRGLVLRWNCVQLQLA